MTSEDYIIDEINRARKFYFRFGKELKEVLHPHLQETLDCVSRSRNVMKELGVDRICRLCDEEEGGSCCGKGIENYYSASLLLANILVSVKLPTGRYDARSCFFLGPRGCTLIFRHTICINYLCKKIYDRLGSDCVIKLQETCGSEIEALFWLNERILAFLKLRADGSINP